MTNYKSQPDMPTIAPATKIGFVSPRKFFSRTEQSKRIHPPQILLPTSRDQNDKKKGICFPEKYYLQAQIAKNKSTVLLP